MPRARRPLCAALARRLPAAAFMLTAGALLTVGCGYKIALQPSPTPGALGVRQIAGLSQPQPTASAQAELAAVLAQAVQAAPALVAAQGTAAQSQSASAPAPPATAAAPARSAFSLEPISAGSGATTLPRAATATVPAAPAASPAATPPTPTATPRAVPSATPAPSAAPTRTPTATPTASATRPSPVQVFLAEGNNDFLYVGPTLPLDQALAPLAGLYTAVSFLPAEATAQVTYRPGLDPVPVLPQNTLVHIGMKRATSFVMYPPR